MKDCIFCKIANKDIFTNMVYEDDNVFAFLDDSPIEKGHTLVISKKHYKNIFDVPEDLIKEMYGITQKIIKSISKAFNVTDFNIIQNNGSKAGQSVFHYHIHIIPRYEKFRVCLGNGPALTEEKIRKGKEKFCSSEVAELIREEL